MGKSGRGKGRGRGVSIFFPKGRGKLDFLPLQRKGKRKGKARGKMKGKSEGRLDFLPCQLESCLFSTTLYELDETIISSQISIMIIKLNFLKTSVFIKTIFYQNKFFDIFST